MAIAEAVKEKEDVEIGADWECPICAEHPQFNAETRAAIEEGRAMLAGKIPGKIYHGSDIYKAIEDVLAGADI